MTFFARTARNGRSGPQPRPSPRRDGYSYGYGRAVLGVSAVVVVVNDGPGLLLGTMAPPLSLLPQAAPSRPAPATSAAVSPAPMTRLTGPTPRRTARPATDAASGHPTGCGP